MAFADAHNFSSDAEKPFVNLRELAIATVAALVVFFSAMQMIVAITTPSMSEFAQKADRLPLAGEVACEGQAWGNWSQECLDTITGSGNAHQLRLIATETVETRDAAANLSVLTRRPLGS